MRDRINFTPEYGTKATQSIIKVIGVGGGGGNAVKHMYKEGIIGIDFLICNTDRCALEASPIPLKLVLGESGLGAGANPEVARKLAMESRDQLIDFIGTETKMLFITAGLGKGTGTGAAPVVAEIAKELGILTIAVVTLPFRFEGMVSAQFAEAGVAELRKHVDSLIIIKNQNIIKYYNDEELDKAFGYADDVLKNAVKCIAELITVNSEQNVDFNDIYAIMKNSGAAMLGIGEASGENRIDDVLEKALKCPLLTEENISNARNFLFSISYGSERKLRICELEKLTNKFDELKSKNAHVIWGRNEDPSLGDKIKLSVIISKYATDTVEFGTVGNNQELYDGDKQKDAIVVNKGSAAFMPSSPFNMEPTNIEEINILKKENDWVGFQNKIDTPETRSSFVLEPTEVVVPVERIPVYEDGPQMIRRIVEPAYEDKTQFDTLVGTPAILQRLRQEDKEEIQDKALQNNRISTFMMEEDVHDFFKNLPD